MKRSIILAALVAAGAMPALADAGVRPVWTDFQPAVATQYRPPDGGRVYPKPDTRTLIRNEDRRASERAEAELNKRALQPLPGRGLGTGRGSSVKSDPLALPPASSTAPGVTPPPPLFAEASGQRMTARENWLEGIGVSNRTANPVGV